MHLVHSASDKRKQNLDTVLINGLIRNELIITLHWTQMADGHSGGSQMANDGLLRPVMSPGLKSPPWSTH